MKLRDYQAPIAEWAVTNLRQHHIAYLAMDMRTGKTPTSLSIAHQYGANNVLFFTRKKALPGIEKVRAQLPGDFTFKALNYERLTTFTTTKETDNGRVDVHFDAEGFLEEFGRPDFIILDEAHCLGQFPDRAGKVKALKEICIFKPILYLSGTPSPESFSQLYHQFYVSSYSPFLEWKTFHEWAKDFVTIGKKYYFNREMNDYSDADQEKVFKFTKHLFMSLTQKEAHFQQEVVDKIIELDMNVGTYALANALLKNRIVIGKDKGVVLADTAAKMQQKLHQIYSGTVICEPEQVKMEDFGKPIKKISKIFDVTKAQYIKNNFTGKLCIFYVFVEEFNALVVTFGHDRLTADPEEFATTDKILAMQIVAGREGVDASTADCLIMYNISFSSVSYIQSRQRLNKLERATAAPCYWLFAKGGIEQKIYDRVIEKQDYTLEYFKKDYGL